MKYLLLLGADGTAPAVDISAECAAWKAELGDKHVTGMGLFPPASASTVRVRDGEVLLTDGPFAETREQTGGLAIIECGSTEEARRLAATHPWARHGWVEVRQLVE